MVLFSSRRGADTLAGGEVLQGPQGCFDDTVISEEDAGSTQGRNHPGFLEVSYNYLQPSRLIEQDPGVLLRVFPHCLDNRD